MARTLISLLIFFSTGVYFLFQTCPTFYFWDSAELTAAILSNGVPHPPGFPFFILLAELWKFLIPADPALVLNLFSAFFAALGLALWYLVIDKFLNDLDFHRNSLIPGILSILTVLLMAFSFTYSIQATRFEVYSLNFAGFAALTYFASNVGHGANSQRYKFAFFVLLGFMLAVHTLTIALAIPGLLIFFLAGERVRKSEIILGVLLTLSIFFGLYGVIYFRAQAAPALNWGEPANVSSLIDYIFARGFSTSIKGDWLRHLLDQALFSFNLFKRQVGLPGLLVALVGFIYYTLNRRAYGLALLTILLLNFLSTSLAGSYFYENYDLHGYLLISLALIVLFLTVGLEFIYQFVARNFSTSKVKSSSIWGLVLSASIGLLICFHPAKSNLFSADLSNVTTAQSYAEEFLSNAPQNSIVLTSSYNTYFCLLARQSCDSQFRDRTVLNIYNWDHHWGKSQANKMLNLDLSPEFDRQDYYRSFVNSLISKRPLYIEFDQASRPLSRYLHPAGLGYLLVADTSYADIDLPIDNIYLNESLHSSDTESIRTWVLWLQCRGEYYRYRGMHELADRYFSALETVASNADIE
jgi:hypothetical protein